MKSPRANQKDDQIREERKRPKRTEAHNGHTELQPEQIVSPVRSRAGQSCVSDGITPRFHANGSSHRSTLLHGH